MNRSRITGAILLRWDDCTSILSKHLTTLLQRPIQLCHMVEDYDYWCIALKTGRFSIPELHVLLDAISATTTDFPADIRHPSIRNAACRNRDVHINYYQILLGEMFVAPACV